MDSLSNKTSQKNLLPVTGKNKEQIQLIKLSFKNKLAKNYMKKKFHG